MQTILRYCIAVLSVAIANGLAFFVLRHFEAILTPFLFAVAVTVWYAGTGPGVLAIVLSVLSLNYFCAAVNPIWRRRNWSSRMPIVSRRWAN